MSFLVLYWTDINLYKSVELEQETHNPPENVAYVIISDLFQDIVQIKNSCFCKVKRTERGQGLRNGIRLRQLLWSYTPITIIP